MIKREIQTTLAIAAIFAFRMLGLFMILPIFTLYAANYQENTPKLAGLALGIYGLSQALLQFPFGLLSDRIGRKTVITLGLGLFAIGSAIAALATTIGMVIVGRAIQGAGAIGSATLALLSDSTSLQSRSKAMAIVGTAIGASFICAMVLGPLLSHWVGLTGIFWMTGALALLGIVLLATIPTPLKIHSHLPSRPTSDLFQATLKNPNLLRLYFGIFSLHAVLTATFTALPPILTEVIQLSTSQQWMLYLPIMVVAGAMVFPFLSYGEQKSARSLFSVAIGTLIITQLMLHFFHQSLLQIVLPLLGFFIAFSLLEALLPSMVSKVVSTESKGSALGIYSTTQFLGIFVGGILAGIIHQHYGLDSIFILNSLIAFVWLILSLSLKLNSGIAYLKVDNTIGSPILIRTLSNEADREVGV